MTADKARYRIQIEATPQFLADESDPDSDRYVFAYTITVENTGEVAAQLISRHWIITDADLHVQEVRGQGVVGEQPTLKPGERFQYTSGCALNTPFGSMRGSYRMRAADGTEFDADIPEFALAGPRTLH
jgi:ApaG protein